MESYHGVAAIEGNDEVENPNRGVEVTSKARGTLGGGDAVAYVVTTL